MYKVEEETKMILTELKGHMGSWNIEKLQLQKAKTGVTIQIKTNSYWCSHIPRNLTD